MEACENTRRAPQRPPPPSTSSRVETIKNFRDLQKVHDSAHKFVNSGLQADERSDAPDAMHCYSEGLKLIDMALRIDCERLSGSSNDQIDQAKQMQQKMTKTKQQVMFRIQSLQAELQNASDVIARTDADAPPTYEDAMREPGSPVDFLDAEMMSLGDSIMNGEMERQNLTDASHMFSIEDGVQIFYISPEGFVSAPSYPSSLHVVKLPDGHQAASQSTNPPAFIHVNDWVYPLVPGSSPALQTSYGAYMFPDLMSQQPGAAVGLLLPETLPPETRQQFEQVIKSFTVYQTEGVASSSQALVSPSQENVSQMGNEIVTQEQSPAPRASQGSTDTSTKISKGIVVAADWIAWGLSKGATKAGELIRAGSEKIREKTRPATQDHKVDPRIKTGLVYARKATHVSVQVTGYLVTKLGEATSALAREIAPHLKEKGEKLIPKSVTKTDQGGKSKLDGVVEVAASGLKGFGTVYVSLEAAAKSLGKSLTNETVSIVHHKYGAEAGQAAEHSMYTAGNAAMTAFNANNFGVKAVAKRAAKDTGKAVLEDFNKDKTDHRGYVPCESNVDDESYGGAVGGRPLGGGASSSYQVKR